MTFKEYSDYDALGLAELIRAGDVSPAEVMRAAEVELERWNPVINAVVHRQEPDPYQASGIFAGVPFLLKDLLVFSTMR